MNRRSTVYNLAATVALAVTSASTVRAQYEDEPINYGTAPLQDRISKLQQRIDRGEVTFAYDDVRGYLDALLAELGVPVSSQTLVFTKTSFQRDRISPRTPRAVYFADDVYVGWVAGAEVLEVSSVDPQLGAVFYTLSQDRSAPPKFARRDAECLQCHGSSLTRGVPGHLVRSVFPDADGHPILRGGTFTVDHTTPIDKRWGGWYVSGIHGRQRHLGNEIAADKRRPETLDREAGANVLDLRKRVELSNYPSHHSDIAALMVLDHQAQLHNLITYATYQTKIALRDQSVLDEALERTSPPGNLNAATRRRIASAVKPIVEYMLFVDEAPLVDPIRGTSKFAREFAAVGPRDRQGRSLRDLDLGRRMFKYPCSYLIYSEAFEGLPGPAKEEVYRRLWAVLGGEERDERFAHLSDKDRQAIVEILRDTKSGLPGYWRVEREEKRGRRSAAF